MLGGRDARRTAGGTPALPFELAARPGVLAFCGSGLLWLWSSLG